MWTRVHGPSEFDFLENGRVVLSKYHTTSEDVGSRVKDLPTGEKDMKFDRDEGSRVGMYKREGTGDNTDILFRPTPGY